METNPLAHVSRWQMLDNMRRSLTPAGLVLLLAAGWLFLPGSPWAWTALAMVVFLFPIYAHLATGLSVDPRAVPWGTHYRNLFDDAILNCQQALLTLSALPHQAYSAVDAVLRTLWRMFVSRKNLLEWTAAAVAERQRRQCRPAAPRARPGRPRSPPRPATARCSPRCGTRSRRGAG